MEDGKWGSWGIVIFLIILFAVFMNGGFGGLFGYGRNGCVDGLGGYGFQDYKAICETQKQDIANTARTQYLTEQQSAATRELVAATANTTQAKIDFYAYQGLRDQLAETKSALMEANNKLFVKEQLEPVNASLATIQCQMLRRPDVTGIGAVCPNAGIINGLGLNNLNHGCGGCCGCGVL